MDDRLMPEAWAEYGRRLEVLSRNRTMEIAIAAKRGTPPSDDDRDGAS